MVLEAMAAQVPVLASFTDGIDELLEARTGCLWKVSPNTPEGWSEALVSAYKAPDILQSQIRAGQELVQSRTWTRTAEQYVASYQDVVSRFGGAVSHGSG